MSLEADSASGEPSCNCDTRWYLYFSLWRDPESGDPARRCPDSKPTETGHDWKSLTLGLFASWQWATLLLSLTWYVPFIVSSKIVRLSCRSSHFGLQNIDGLIPIGRLCGSADHVHKEICEVSRTFQQSSHYDSQGKRYWSVFILWDKIVKVWSVKVLFLFPRHGLAHTLTGTMEYKMVFIQATNAIF